MPLVLEEQILVKLLISAVLLSALNAAAARADWWVCTATGQSSKNPSIYQPKVDVHEISNVFPGDAAYGGKDTHMSLGTTQYYELQYKKYLQAANPTQDFTGATASCTYEITQSKALRDRDDMIANANGSASLNNGKVQQTGLFVGHEYPQLPGKTDSAGTPPRIPVEAKGNIPTPAPASVPQRSRPAPTSQRKLRSVNTHVASSSAPVSQRRPRTVYQCPGGFFFANGACQSYLQVIHND